MTNKRDFCRSVYNFDIFRGKCGSELHIRGPKSRFTF
jgi:hypothetical protein